MFNDTFFKKIIKVKSGPMGRSCSSLTGFSVKGSLTTDTRYAHGKTKPSDDERRR